MLDRRQLLRLSAAAGFIAGLGSSAARAADTDFATWLAAFKEEAASQGIRSSTLELAFAGVEPIAKVLELDRRQPEATLSFEDYIARVVNPNRIAAGRRKLEENGGLLDEIGSRYGVQPRFIVALWGIETDFGAITGSYPVVAALATLAYDGRRGALFRAELIAALKILDRGRIRPAELKGSWAGAMGQTQFMPSSFLKFAVDYDGTGREDIWNDRADVFASIANYLASSGWDGTHTWGRRVSLPDGFDAGLLGGQVLKPLGDWQALGVRRTDGGPLPAADLNAGLVQPGGPAGPTLAVYDNYRVILKWNRSLYFATATSYLADAIDS